MDLAEEWGEPKWFARSTVQRAPPRARPTAEQSCDSPFGVGDGWPLGRVDDRLARARRVARPYGTVGLTARP